MESNTKFARRLGPRPDDTDGERGDPRPLLVGFTHRHHTELITENSWKLSESDNPAIRQVSVVSDLTIRQRAGEKEMLREVARKNLARSKEHLEGNMAFNVVGRIGANREILALGLGRRLMRRARWCGSLNLREGRQPPTQTAHLWGERVEGG